MLNIIAAQIGVPAAAPAGPPVAGYKLWLDASDTTTITASGGSVSQWADLSGYSSNFTQGTGANQPTTGTRTLNSLNVIDFDGTNDVLSCPSSTALFNYLHNSTGGTTFFVGQIDTTGSQLLYMNNGGSSSTVGTYYDLNGGTNFSLISRGAPGATTATSSGDITVSTGSGFSLVNKFDGNNATAANRILSSYNGGSFLGSNVATNAPSSSNATNNFTLGTMDGYIAEIIFYSGILSNGDITSVRSYLTTKWGI